MSADTDKLIREARAAGWTVERRSINAPFTDSIRLIAPTGDAGIAAVAWPGRRDRFRAWALEPTARGGWRQGAEYGHWKEAAALLTRPDRRPAQD